MRKILSLFVLGSICVLSAFAMEKKDKKKEDGFFVREYKDIIKPKNAKDPLLKVIILFSLPKDNKVTVKKDNKLVEVGKQFSELDSNPDQKLEDNEFMQKLVSNLNQLLQIVGLPTKTESYEESERDSIASYTTVQKQREVKIPGKYQFVVGIRGLIEKLDYFIACKTCNMGFEEALHQLAENGNLTAEDVKSNFQYGEVINLIEEI